jgi:hypothetical protein
MVKISMVVASHLNDAMEETSIDSIRFHLMFVKALVFWNENTTKQVTDDYLTYLWNEVVAGRNGMSFDNYKTMKQ